MRNLMSAYLKELGLSGKSKNTVEAYAYHLDRFATWIEENGIDFTQVNGKESRAFRNYLVEQGLAPKTVNTILGAVKSFYDYLCEEGVIKGNPFIMKRLRVAEERRQPDFLTEAELPRILKALEELPCHVALAFRTMLAAGLRVSEAARLMPEDVILERGSVFLRVRRGKGDKERLAPVTDAQVAKDLVEYAGEVSEEYPGQSLFYVTAGTLKVYAHRLKKFTGVDFHSHRMRHTLATRLLAQGTPIDVVQKVLGHADISTTRRYAETLPEALFRVAAKVQETGKAADVAVGGR